MPKRPIKKSSLAESLGGYMEKRDTESSVWRGPLKDGITQSMLHEYLNCLERFRIWVVEGLKAPQDFEVKVEYGQIWHAMEEVKAANGTWQEIDQAAKDYCRVLARKYRMRGAEIQKWYNVAKVEFQVYIEFWKNHKEEKGRTPIFQEKVFAVPYELPSRRTILLRGKMDAVDRIVGQEDFLYFLQENKSKGQLNEEQISSQLKFDLQSMMYLIALEDFVDPSLIGGIRYNTILRPLSGGKGTIRRWKAKDRKPTKKDPRSHIPAETFDHYYGRLKTIIEEEPERYFKRWTVDVTRQDIERFKQEFFHPVLENLLDDFEWWEYCKKPHAFGKASQFNYRERASVFPLHSRRHFRFPYGIWTSTKDGWKHDLDDYLETGSRVGLDPITEFFEEL